MTAPSTSARTTAPGAFPAPSSGTFPFGPVPPKKNLKSSMPLSGNTEPQFGIFRPWRVATRRILVGVVAARISDTPRVTRPCQLAFAPMQGLGLGHCSTVPFLPYQTGTAWLPLGPPRAFSPYCRPRPPGPDCPDDLPDVLRARPSDSLARPPRTSRAASQGPDSESGARAPGYGRLSG